jgi:hypothetical protein
MALKISSLIFFSIVSYIILENVAAIPQGNVDQFLTKKYEISNFYWLNLRYKTKCFEWIKDVNFYAIDKQ